MGYQILWLWLAAAVVMALMWWAQTRSKNASHVDVAWAALLAAAAIFYAYLGEGTASVRIALAILGSLWGFRLAWHLAKRLHGAAEDGRYAYLRKHWQGNQLYFFLFFQVQAFLVMLFSLPFWAVAQNQDASMGLIVAAVLVWFFSLLGESIADWQLDAFRKSPSNSGKVCNIGLWRYSRHPNYFFEWLHWFAYALLAIGSAYAWLAILGPVLMFASLMWVSGIPYTEAQSLRSRGDAYKHYQQTTSAFFPWFPRNEKSV